VTVASKLRILYIAVSPPLFDGCLLPCIAPFLDKINELFLFQHITEPTRYRQSDHPSLLDPVLTNEIDLIKDITYLPPLGNSDHICIQFNMVCYSQFKQPTKYKYNVNATDTNLMKDILNNVDWEAMLEPLNMTDAWLFLNQFFRLPLISVFHYTSPK